MENEKVTVPTFLLLSLTISACVTQYFTGISISQSIRSRIANSLQVHIFVSHQPGIGG